MLMELFIIINNHLFILEHNQYIDILIDICCVLKIKNIKSDLIKFN